VTQFYIDEKQPHLGGFIPGGDPATYYPDLWRWLVDRWGARSVLDVGCGEGHALKFFARCGVDNLLGIDGVAQEAEHLVRTHDYTLGPLHVEHIGRFNLCWCCEFVEHVEERYVPNFLATFACADLVLMTHAEPGQQGYHHVNCQPAAYWTGVLAAIGYQLDEALTACTREFARANESPWNHYARSGLAFSRSSEAHERMERA